MFSEKYESQIPALQLLAASGWTILPVSEADRLRNCKRSNILLESVLTRKLQELNSINHKGGVYKFSEANIQDAVQRLKNMPYDGLLRTNEKIYDSKVICVASNCSISTGTIRRPMHFMPSLNFRLSGAELTTRSDRTFSCS